MTKVSNENQETHFTAIVEEDPKTGDLILPLPAELLNSVGWDEETILAWEIVEGAAILRKATPEEIAESK